MPGFPLDDPPEKSLAQPPRSAAGSGCEGLEFLVPSENPAYLGRLGPYEVVGALGEGGMGVVLKAFDPSLSRVVAIKVLAPQMAASGAARRRFSREAKAAAAVVHEHVVAIHAVDTDARSGLPYLVMPYVDGRSLQQRIDHDGPLRTEEILRIGMQTAQGLAAAHAQGLVHRDIKPSNILLENGVERVKITDFGLARAVDDASRSESGVVAGTPQYMSPEQARGETVDHRSDLFSLGSVLYAMCAGHSPFRAKTTMGVLRRVCDEAPRPLGEVNPEVPEELEAVIERLHAKDPAQRYQSAAEVAEALGRQLAQLQRAGRRPARQAAGAGRPSGGRALPIVDKDKAKAPDDWEARRKRPRPRVLAATALLVTLGLALAGSMARFAGRDAMFLFPRAGFGASLVEPAGTSQGTAQQGTSSAHVIITTSQDEDRTIVGSGKPATKQWKLVDFTDVSIRNTFHAEITRGDHFEVTVTADDNVLEHVVVAKEGAQLRVGLENGRTYRLRPDTLKVAITMPALEAIELSGASQATLRDFESDRPFRARISGASKLSGSLRAGDLNLAASGASTLTLQGRAREARLTASGASKLELAGLEVNAGKLMLDLSGASTARARGSAKAAVLQAGGASRLNLADLALEAADVTLSSASHATIRVTGLLNYDLSSASRLEYLGEPTIDKAKRTGASSVSHR
jgi:serine/threonine-protein kinase